MTLYISGGMRDAMILIFTAVFMALTAATPLAQTDHGQWLIQTKTDTITDKVVCLAVYKADPNVQIDDGGLAISYRGRGGVKGFYYRLGDLPISSMQVREAYRPSSADVLVLSNPKFVMKAIDSGRLRVRALTYLGELIDTDVDLTEVNGLIFSMMQLGCLSKNK